MTQEFTYTRQTRRGIVRDLATVDVDGIGPVDFERPSLWDMGARRWHVEVEFTHNRRRYFATVYARIDFDLYTHTEKGARRLPETAKAQWRAAIHKVARRILRAAASEYLAAVDSGNDEAAQALAMGRAPTPAARAITTPAEFVARIRPQLNQDAARAYHATRDKWLYIVDSLVDPNRIDGEKLQSRDATVEAIEQILEAMPAPTPAPAPAPTPAPTPAPAPVETISAALTAWNRAKQIADYNGLIDSGNVLAELLDAVRNGEAF